ncbi:MAG: outer membrane beta-barrel protein [Bacteroidota bacterium]
MKRIFLIFLAAMVVTSVVSAQKQVGEPFLKKLTTGIELFSDIVMDAPDGIDFRTINQGVNVFGLYTYPIKESNFAFAIGAGLGMHNFFSNGLLLNDSTNTSFFASLDTTKALNGDKTDYKKNKISLTYLDFPVELRFKSEKGFRFAVGAKVGVKLNAHTKYKGDNFTDGSKIKIKESDLSNFETWRFGPTLQIGYKWVSITGFYSITRIFKKNAGPQIYPVSIGISLRPF